MSALDDVIKRIYGNRLNRKDTQGYAHHLYTLYQDKNTHENYFLRSVDFPIHMHISDAIIEVVTKKYDHIISPIKIMPLSKDFQSQNYLLRAPQNIILLSTYLQIKRQCSQVLDIGFFFRFLEFIVGSYKILEPNKLSLFTLNQIGLSDKEQFILCDPSLYFKSKEHDLGNLPFAKWIGTLINEFTSFSLDLQDKERQKLMKERFGQDISIIKPLIEYLLSETTTPDTIMNKIYQSLNRISDEATTVTSSFVDINSSLLDRSVKHSSFQKQSKSYKINKIGRMVIVFVVLAVIIAAGYFCFQFFNRKIVCDEGYFLSDENQCKNCFDGCLRCSTNEPSKCMRCSVSMYLVLEEQDDSEGFCLKECRGRQINMGVCLKQKQHQLTETDGEQIQDMARRIYRLSLKQTMME